VPDSSRSERILQGVPVEALEVAWPHVEGYLKAAIERSEGVHTIESVQDALAHKDMQLWLSMTDEGVEACCVTQIIDHPEIRVCAIPLIGGKNHKAWRHFQEDIARWADEKGCSEMEGYARRGWLRFILKEGWKPVWTTVRRPIDGRI